MLLACHSLINLPLPLNASRRLCVPQRTVTHRGGGASKGVTMKTVPLANTNLVALVSDKDYSKVRQVRWKLATSSAGINYAITYRNGAHLFMHSFILNRSKMIDHRDRDGLNNTRRNLRPCNSSQNRANSVKMKKAATSRFKGVYLQTQPGRKPFWRAQVSFDGKKYMLGSFKSEIEAAKAYNRKLKLYFGRFARLNEI